MTDIKCTILSKFLTSLHTSHIYIITTYYTINLLYDAVVGFILSSFFLPIFISFTSKPARSEKGILDEITIVCGEIKCHQLMEMSTDHHFNL